MQDMRRDAKWALDNKAEPLEATVLPLPPAPELPNLQIKEHIG